MEIWKNIKDYNGDYEISSLGRVKSNSRKIRFTHPVTNQEHFRTTKEKILKCTLNNKTGYLMVTLKLNNLSKTYNVHRLVAEHFINSMDYGLVVNHKDCNKCNNNVSNLEWITSKKNSEHAKKNNLIVKGENHYKSFLSDKDVIEIRKSKLSTKELANKYNCEYRAMWQIVKGITRK